MAIGRPKHFSRAQVMERSIPVFWQHGFASTSLADLEAATGVNRSGLYTEFRDKEDLFLASLGHYIATSGLANILATEPLGWDNVEKYSRLYREQGQVNEFYDARRPAWVPALPIF